jgi:tRNA(adenine34) deaminase
MGDLPVNDDRARPDPHGTMGLSDVRDECLMRRALALAGRAEAQGEVPVGALVVDEHGTVIGEGWNQPISLRDPCAHAEISALRNAAASLGAYRLPETTLYVTLEPCPMCVGAMIHARVRRVVFGAPDPKTGACGGAMALHDHPSHNHRLAVTGGVLAADCGERLRGFFRARRAASRAR